MKKLLYLVLCTIFGIMVSFFVYIFLEIAIIYLIINIFDNYLKLSYEIFLVIENIFLLILLAVGSGLGLYFGKKRWKYVYIDKKYKRQILKF